MSLRSVFEASAIKTEFEKAGINTHFIPLIWKYVIHNPNCEWEDIPSLPSAAYPFLRSKFKTLSSNLHSVIESSDQVTTKLLIKLQVLVISYSEISKYEYLDPRTVKVAKFDHVKQIMRFYKYPVYCTFKASKYKHIIGITLE